MAWEEIENVRPLPLDAVSPEGVRVRVRAFKARGVPFRRIELTIGDRLARKLSLTLPEHMMKVLIGTGEEAGKMLLAPDQERGKFMARRQKTGRYAMSISDKSAEGLFSLDFPAFVVVEVPVTRAPNCPPAASFALSEAMLDVAD